LSGAIRKQRGVKLGVPDDLAWYRGKSIGLELKSRGGQCSRSQRAVREAMLRAGDEWWECRSAHAAMWALRKSGVKFRTIVHEDGKIECWQQPQTAGVGGAEAQPARAAAAGAGVGAGGGGGGCRAGGSE